jgi:hypothetical protein
MESDLYSIVKSLYSAPVSVLPTPGSNATSLSFTWYRVSLLFGIHYKSPFRLQDELRSGIVLLLHHHPLHPRHSNQRDADKINLPPVACLGFARRTRSATR